MVHLHSEGLPQAFHGKHHNEESVNHLTYAFQSGIKTTCMAMRLVVATTVATNATRVCDPFRTTANVSESSSFEAPQRSPVGSSNETNRVVPQAKEVKNDGC